MHDATHKRAEALQQRLTNFLRCLEPSDHSHPTQSHLTYLASRIALTALELWAATCDKPAPTPPNEPDKRTP